MKEYKVYYCYNGRLITELFYADNEDELRDKLAVMGIFKYGVGIEE